MGETFKIRIRVYKYTLILTCLVSGLSVFIIKDYMAFIYGLLFGTLIASLNFTLLANTLERAAKMTPEKAKAYATSRYFIRYMIYGIVLYISIVADYINIIGTIVGLLVIKIVILVLHAFNDKSYYKKIFRKR